MKREVRFLAVSDMRAESQGDEATLVGYASKFNSQSQDLGGFRETVMPGAFARSIREGADVKFLMNHDPSMVMGRTKNGTLELSEDPVGLKFKVKLPNTQAARDLYTLVKRGDMDQCSFAFTAKDQSWEDVREGGDLYASRKLMDVDLIDVSAVTYPAYNSTEVYARHIFPEGMPTEVRSHAVGRRPERRYSEGTYEDMIQDINCALKEKYGLSSSGTMWQGCPKYWVVETYEDHVVAQNNDEGCYYSIPYECEGDDITFGEPQKVEQTYVPSGRALLLAELRGSENQPPENGGGGNTPVQIQWPLASNIKDDWFKAFEEAYDDLVKKGGRDVNIKEALAFAVNVANKKVQPKTETPDGVKGGKGKDPSDVPHEVVDTYGGRTAVIGEERKYSKPSDVPAYVPADKKAQFMEVWNSAYAKAKKDGKEAQEAESSAFAQANSVTGASPKGWTKGDDGSWKKRGVDEVSDPDSPDYDPDDPDYDPEWASKRGRTDGKVDPSRQVDDVDLDETNRAAGKTKKVAGKDLSSSDFAYVGDPQDPSTWKLPIHDEGHARNALARFNQTKGIPADKKDAVWKRIVAAAKKFGIEVSDKDSLRAGVAHDVTLAALGEDEAATQAIRDRMRVLEIDLA